MTTKTILNDLIKQLEKREPNNIASVKLFGSRAREDYSRNSDIDVLIVTKKNHHRIENLVRDYVVELLIQNGPYLSVKIYDKKKYNLLNKKRTFFIQKLEKDAIELWKI